MIIVTPSPYGHGPGHDDCQDVQVLKQKYAAVINVSDGPELTFDLQAAGVPSYWFPVHEVNQWGYGPFYGAAKVYDRYNGNILIHCHAGVNRSRCITYAILKAHGWTDSAILSGYGGWVLEQWETNVQKGYIYEDTIDMLKARYQYPTYSLMGLLGIINSKHLHNKTKEVDALIQKFYKK